MDARAVEAEQQAMGAVVWMMCSPSLEDRGRANVDVHSALSVFLFWSGVEVS